MNSGSTPTASFSLTSASDPFATADVEDINDDQLDDTVLIYTNDNQVHLELLNQNGVQIGSDFVVPGLTSFDQIETLTGRPGRRIIPTPGSKSTTRSPIPAAGPRSKASSTTSWARRRLTPSTAPTAP